MRRLISISFTYPRQEGVHAITILSRAPLQEIHLAWQRQIRRSCLFILSRAPRRRPVH
ncbi:MAG: hypothetical protein LZF62_210023 [Nitrospira sp.]|nr:MAG: hypothetical protein LZF62_210023 [Nitrospira sp.]